MIPLGLPGRAVCAGFLLPSLGGLCSPHYLPPSTCESVTIDGERYSSDPGFPVPTDTFVNPIERNWIFPVARMVKNLPAVQETWVPSLGWEDPLEKGMATYSGILAWRITWTEEPGGLQSMGLQKLDMTERLTL